MLGCGDGTHCLDRHLYHHHYVDHHTLDCRDDDVARRRVFYPNQANENVVGTGLGEIL